jgi:alanine racemase
MDERSPSMVTVDLGAYAHNLDVVRRLTGKRTRVIAIVKADAYGHGIVPVAKRAVKWGVDFLGVATVEESAALRGAGIRIPIILLVQPDISLLREVVDLRLRLCLSDLRIAEALGKMAGRANWTAPVHCKIDTGMGRQGFSLAAAPENLKSLTHMPHVDIEGIATHFPSADQKGDPFARDQIRLFKQLLKHLERQGIPYEIAHAANSAGVINYPESVFDGIRPGLMTYGISPVEHAALQSTLMPVLRWETKVALLRELESGASVGYGRTYATLGAQRMAMLPVGYADGYKYALANKADVLIRGRRCPVRGSVCMDQIMVDVSHVSEVRVGDTATLIGVDGEESITAHELAQQADTIPYDILTGIGARVGRKHTG